MHLTIFLQKVFIIAIVKSAIFMILTLERQHHL